MKLVVPGLGWGVGWELSSISVLCDKNIDKTSQKVTKIMAIFDKFLKISDNCISALVVLIEQPLSNWKKTTEALHWACYLFTYNVPLKTFCISPLSSGYVDIYTIWYENLMVVKFTICLYCLDRKS